MTKAAFAADSRLAQGNCALSIERKQDESVNIGFFSKIVTVVRYEPIVIDPKDSRITLIVLALTKYENA